MHCFYFGQILQTVWPHPVIEGTGKWCWLCSFLKPMVLSLSLLILLKCKISQHSNEIICHCEKEVYMVYLIFQQRLIKSFKTFIPYITYFTCHLIKMCMLAYREYFKNTEKTAMLQTSLDMWLIIMGCCSCQLKNWSLVMLSLFPSNVIKGIPSNQDRQLEMLNFKNINLFILTSHIKPSP